MVSEKLRRFFLENPLLYSPAAPDDLEQLSGIRDLYPDSVRLLTDTEAVELPDFECLRCGRCCSSVKYITVCFGDVKRWVAQRRADILDNLVIDRRKTPFLAMRKNDINDTKVEARSLLVSSGLEDERYFELLYVTRLLECAVYVGRSGSACTFLRNDNGRAICGIQETKPKVCDKFPYYIGKYTDSRLIKEDSFCPSLKNIARELKKG